MNSLTFDCIIFDFDGTLSRLTIDFGLMREKIIELCRQYRIGDEDFRDHYVLEMVDKARTVLTEENRLADAQAFTDRAYGLIRAIEMEGARTGSLLAGVRELFMLLRNRRIRTGIITRNCAEAVLTVWPDIAQYCDTLLTRDGVLNVKPHPAHLYAALSALAASPAASAMVGDHPLDIRVGRSVGTFTIGVLTGNSTEQALRDAGADLVLDTAPSLAGYI